MGLGKTLRKLKLNATSSTTSPAGSPGVGNHNASDSEDSDSSFGCVDAKDVEALHGLQQDQSSKHPSLVSPAATPQQQQQVQFACEWCGRTVLPGKEEEIKDVAGLEKLCQKCAAANSKWVVCGTCKLKDTRHPGGKCRSCRGSSKSPRNSEVSFASTAEMVGSSRAKGNEDDEKPPEVPPKDEKWKRHARCFSDPSGKVTVPQDIQRRRHKSTSGMDETIPEEFRGLVQIPDFMF